MTKTNLSKSYSFLERLGTFANRIARTFAGTGSRWIIALAVLSPFAPLSYAQSWYNSSWTYRKPITITHTQVSGSSALTNFPILYSVTDSGLVGNTQSNGNDILFTASDGVTKLNHEIESYASSTGVLVAWVQVSSVSPTTDTVIYIYYGNSGAANQQNATGVWDSNYKAVYHLNTNPNGTAPQLLDSTSNGINLTTAANPSGAGTGSMANSTGQMGSGVNFSSPNQYWGYQASSSSAAGLSTGSRTYSGWVKFNSFVTYDAGYAGIFGTEISTNTYPDYTDAISINSTHKLYLDIFEGSGGGGGPNTSGATSAITTGTWYYIVGTFDSSNMLVYLNGTLAATTALSGPSGDGTVRLNYVYSDGGRVSDAQI